MSASYLWPRTKPFRDNLHSVFPNSGWPQICPAEGGLKLLILLTSLLTNHFPPGKGRFWPSYPCWHFPVNKTPLLMRLHTHLDVRCRRKCYDPPLRFDARAYLSKVHSGLTVEPRVIDEGTLVSMSSTLTETVTANFLLASTL
jgi:hypothetical protein